MLYVQKGTEKREVISKTLFNAFCDNFSDKLFSDEKMFLSINIDWTDHHLGRGLIACLDNDTAAWVKAQAEAFSFEGQTIREWARDEFGSRVVYQGFLLQATGGVTSLKETFRPKAREPKTHFTSLEPVRLSHFTLA